MANAVLTQSAVATYTFEVSTDTSFGTKVYSKSGVAAGASGQTSLTIDKIPAGTSYFWHARAEGGGTTGPFTSPRAFSDRSGDRHRQRHPGQPDRRRRHRLAAGVHGDQRDAFGSDRHADLQVRDRHQQTRSARCLMSATVPEGAIRTTFTPASDLPAETSLFWRVTVSDVANGVSGPTTLPGSFVTTFAIDLTKVVYLNSPNVSSWPQTATSSRSSNRMAAATAPSAWPTRIRAGPTRRGRSAASDPNFGVYANQWYFARINGTWYGGAGEWIYRGASSCKAGQGTNTIGPDAGFGPPFNTWVPKVGELVGFMVSSVARNGPVRRTVDERSNIIVQPWRERASARNARARFTGSRAPARHSFCAPALPADAAAAGAAQTPAAPCRAVNARLREAVAESAFGNVTSQAFGAEIGVTVRPALQVFGSFGRFAT